MHFDPLIQFGVFLVCLGVFAFLVGQAVKAVRFGRKPAKKHDHESRETGT